MRLQYTPYNGKYLILDKNIKITKEIYKQYIIEIEKGKCFKLKESYSTDTFENLFEEYTIEIPITIGTINNQVRTKIVERYDIEQELQMLNKALIDTNNAEYLTYKQYREECITWGITEKQKYNLI